MSRPRGRPSPHHIDQRHLVTARSARATLASPRRGCGYRRASGNSSHATLLRPCPAPRTATSTSRSRSRVSASTTKWALTGANDPATSGCSSVATSPKSGGAVVDVGHAEPLVGANAEHVMGDVERGEQAAQKVGAGRVGGGVPPLVRRAQHECLHGRVLDLDEGTQERRRGQRHLDERPRSFRYANNGLHASRSTSQCSARCRQPCSTQATAPCRGPGCRQDASAASDP